MPRLPSKVALITGAAQGIGKAVLRLSSPARADATLVRAESTRVVEAAGKAHPPVWVTLGNPVVGVVGVIVGGSLLGTLRSGGEPVKDT